MGFQRSISLFSLLGTSFNCMIGSGWLMTMYYCATHAGPASLLSWLFSAILISIIAFCFSELSTTFPIAGGIARYSHFSHGTSISFGLSLLAWLSCAACVPTEVQTIISHLGAYSPDWLLSPDDPHNLSHAGTVLAIFLLALMSWLNTIGMSWLMKLNDSLASWKLVFPLFVMLWLLFGHFQGQRFYDHGMMPMGIEGVLEATTFAAFSFLGFREATSLASEVKNPHIAIPVAVLGSVLFCFLLYAGLQIAFIGAIQDDMLTHGWAHLSYPGQSGPLVGLTQVLGLAWLSQIIAADALISPLGTGTVYTATSARLVYALGKNRFIPHCFTTLSSRGIPYYGLLLNFIVGSFLFFALKDWQELVKFQTSAMFVAYAVGPISLCALRSQLPELKRPFKLPCPFAFCLLGLFACNLLLLWGGWLAYSRILIALFAGYLLLWLYLRAQGNQHQWHIDKATWALLHYLGLGLLSYSASYDGGMGYLTPGYDLIATFILSSLVLYFAYHARLPRSTCLELLGDDHYDFDDAV